MNSVLQMIHELDGSPEASSAPGVRLRTYAGTRDIGAWLDLRDRAFARERVGVRSWTEADFAGEFLDRPWWSPERFWLAEAVEQSEPILVGAVALAFRGHEPSLRPVVHWLAVAPRWRRRGVGRLLVTTLEAEAWRLGYRAVYLETHAAWTAAEALYRGLGYRPLLDATDGAKAASA